MDKRNTTGSKEKVDYIKWSFGIHFPRAASAIRTEHSTQPTALAMYQAFKKGYQLAVADIKSGRKC